MLLISHQHFLNQIPYERSRLCLSLQSGSTKDYLSMPNNQVHRHMSVNHGRCTILLCCTCMPATIHMYICTRWLYITRGNGLFSHRCPADVLHVRCGAQIYMASAGVGVSRSEGRQHSCEIHAQTLLEFHRRLGHPALGWVHIARRRWKSRRAFSSHCTCIALNRSYVHTYVHYTYLHIRYIHVYVNAYTDIRTRMHA